jgi:hypothetical protein
VVKQVRRGKFVEAFGYYERYVLQPLVEALRLAYAPRRSDYYVKDIYRDLPAEVTAELIGSSQTTPLGPTSSAARSSSIAGGLSRSWTRQRRPSTLRGCFLC